MHVVTTGDLLVSHLLVLACALIVGLLIGDITGHKRARADLFVERLAAAARKAADEYPLDAPDRPYDEHVEDALGTIRSDEDRSRS